MTHIKLKSHLTVQILIAMALGLLCGLLIRWIPFSEGVRHVLVDNILDTGGQIFFSLLKMLVVPVVFVSLVCGCSALGDIRQLGRIGGKTVVLYLFTTALAISIALFFAHLFGIGDGLNLGQAVQFAPKAVPTFHEVLLNLVPTNVVKALAEAHMLQIIVFSLLLGMSINMAGKSGEVIATFFNHLNEVVMKLVMIVMKIAPYGVFCLLAALFSKLGFHLIKELLEYFVLLLFVLMLQLFGVYALLLRLVGRLKPSIFYRKMRAAMLFAFSVSSSSASIPVTLASVRDRLGVKNSVASFVVPLGATINMDGTAMMQGVATVFIAHAYHVDIGLVGYLTVIAMATLASIGTAGVPGVGLITLAMVLKQVGLPVEGIGLVIGVDRLLDMTRTAVNVAGDATIACLVGKSEKALDEAVYSADSDHR